MEGKDAWRWMDTNKSQSYMLLRSCNSSDSLNHDEACLQVNSAISEPVLVQKKFDECYHCALTSWNTILKGNSSFVLSTNYTAKYVYNIKDTTCNISFPFSEKGVYGLNLTEDVCGSVWVIQEPDNSFFSFLIVFAAVIFGTLIWKILRWAWNYMYMVVWRHGSSLISELESDIGNVTMPEGMSEAVNHERQNSLKRLKTRVKALDTFRGLTIALMIFVNYGGGGYWIFEHTPWNGLTLADLVFPWFSWIMGMSASLFLRSQLRRTTSRRELFVCILRRSLLLILLGVMLNTIGGYRNGFSDIRVLGVLQRLGFSYFIVASMEAVFMKPQRTVITGCYGNIEDLLECWKQWIVVILFIVCHTCLTFLLTVPDCPIGYLGPGGLHSNGMYENCTGGAAGYIDRVILGQSHMYNTPTCRIIYRTNIPYDPEGILGIMTTVLIVFLGVQAGRILLTYKNSVSRIVRWLVWSILTGLIAGSLCHFSKEEGIIPVNKNLWSLSYVLSTASIAFLFLAVLFYMIDIKNWWGGQPFYFAGLNPLLLYVGHCLTKGMFPWFWKPIYNSHEELLAMNIWGTALWIVISYILYHYHIFVSL